MSTTDVKSKTDDIKNKANELKTTVSQKVQAHSQKVNETMEDVRTQLQTYGNQIQEYLNNIEADIESYKFAIEKKGEGLGIDVAFKATIRSRDGVTVPNSEITPWSLNASADLADGVAFPTSMKVTDEEDSQIKRLSDSSSIESLSSAIMQGLNEDSISRIIASFLYFKSNGRPDKDFVTYLGTKEIWTTLTIGLNVMGALVPALIFDKEFRVLVLKTGISKGIEIGSKVGPAKIAQKSNELAASWISFSKETYEVKQY